MKPRSEKWIVFAILPLSVLLLGCGGGGTSTATIPPPTAIPPAAVSGGTTLPVTPEPPQTSSTVTSDQSTRTVSRPSSSPSAPDSEIAAMERETIQRINALRTERGFGPLQPESQLMQVAHSYSCLMAQRNFFSHTGPSGDTVADRVQEVGITYRFVGENLARNTNAPQPVDAAVQGWMDSEQHRANILRPDFSMTGVGICREGNRYFFTQVFLQPR